MAVGGTIPDCQLAGVVFGLTDVLGQLLIQRFGDSQYGPQMGQMGHDNASDHRQRATDRMGHKWAKWAIRPETGPRSETGTKGAKGVKPHETKGHENITATIPIGSQWAQTAHAGDAALRTSDFGLRISALRFPVQGSRILLRVACSDFGFRISDFFRTSDFGLRISA